MTALAIGTSTPSAKFPVVGTTVAGLIIDFGDVQEREYVQGQPGKGKPKWWGEDGKPVALDATDAAARGLRPLNQVRIQLEQKPGDPESRVNLYVSGVRMKNAVQSAMAAAGVDDISPQSELSVTFIGQEGPAKCYTAKYTPFDPTTA